MSLERLSTGEYFTVEHDEATDTTYFSRPIPACRECGAVGYAGTLCREHFDALKEQIRRA